MYSNNNNGSRATGAGFMALFAMLAMGLGATAPPAEAQPFAYVTNAGSNSVSVIKTAINTVVATVPVGTGPRGVAVTPDGKRVYVTNAGSNSVSVIKTATNTVLTGTGFPIPVGKGPIAVAVTPDGKRVYVANPNSDSVSVIKTATNTVAGLPITVGNVPLGAAVTPE